MLGRAPEGLERSRKANWKHGRYSAEAIATRREAATASRLLRRKVAALYARTSSDRLLLRDFIFSGWIPPRMEIAQHSAFSTWLEAGKYCICGARNAARNRANVMEIVANSSSDRRQVGRQKDPQRSSVTNGSKLRIEGCSAWVRRCKDIIEAQILDPGGEDNCSAAAIALSG
jgi:hypothetical protein